MLNELAQKVFQIATSKGWYDNDKGKNMGERLALIHAEVSEALEADRKDSYCGLTMINWDALPDSEFMGCYDIGVKGTFEEEMADIVIRVLDMCALKGIDIEKHIWAKMRYNSMRPHLHGGKKY